MGYKSYTSLKDSIDFNRAVSLRGEFKLKNHNWEEASEEETLRYGLALMFLEDSNKLNEVDKDIDNRLYEENNKWYLKETK